MKTLILLASLISLTSFAENTVQSQSSASEAGNQGRSYSVEVSFLAMGDLGSQAAKEYDHTSTSSNHFENSYRSTDGLVALTLRKTFSNDFDLSLTAPVYSLISHERSYDESYSSVGIYPVSLGARYHMSFFGDKIRPFAQVDLGEAFLQEYDVYVNDQGIESSNYYPHSSLRPFAKFLVGSDFALAQNSPFYLGVKCGYLAIKEYAAFNSGVSLGYAF